MLMNENSNIKNSYYDPYYTTVQLFYANSTQHDRNMSNMKLFKIIKRSILRAVQ